LAVGCDLWLLTNSQKDTATEFKQQSPNITTPLPEVRHNKNPPQSKHQKFIQKPTTQQSPLEGKQKKT